MRQSKVHARRTRFRFWAAMRPEGDKFFAAPYALYERTNEREKHYPFPELGVDGKTTKRIVTLKTATFRLSPHCKKYWLKKAKRGFA